jgi:phosphate transport system protein
MMRPSDMTQLDQDLQDVNASLVRMLSQVREACELARRALIDGDLAAAERCVENDARIDAMQASLELRILTVIARRQPAASDLRFLGAAYQSLADIERAGDYAEHVARAAVTLAEQPALKKYLDMARILEVLGGMIDTTMKAVAEADVDAARRAHAMDKEIDDLYEQIQRELLTYMIEDPGTIGRATQLLAVARYLERLGDHFENVDEHVMFWLTGERPA